jgi:hypothetical protein
MRGRAWRRWTRAGLEIGALLALVLVGVIAALGQVAEALAGTGPGMSLVFFAGAVLLVGGLGAGLFRGWVVARRRVVRRAPALPPVAALAAAIVACWIGTSPAFQGRLTSLRSLLGGRAETERMAIAHQVYANYRRTNLAALERVLERSRVYEATVREAAVAFGVDVEVLMGVGAAESGFYPRDSADGGRGLFQITAPPAGAIEDVRRRLRTEQLDPLNQRHNAFLAAATLRRYLDQMRGDPFLGLLAYNIGPHNGGLRAIMEQYGARDFVTIQPYLHTLPRDYPIRVLSGALAYRVWRTEGRLLAYEDGGNARHIQGLGIPGLIPRES